MEEFMMKSNPAFRIAVTTALRVLAGVAILAPAQEVPSPPSAPEPAPPAPGQGPTLDETELEQLVAPVALYPDPLLAQVLPAATYPSEVESAAAWLQGNPNPT